MLQFNSILSHSLSLKLFPYWRLSSLLSTSVVNPEISNTSKQDDASLIQSNEDLSTKDKVSQTAKSQLQKELSKIPTSVKHFQHKVNVESHVQNKIKNAKSTEDLIGIMKSPDITIDHVKQILNLISSRNSDVEQKKLLSADAKGVLTKVNVNKVEIDNSKIIPLATPSLIQVLKKLSYSNERNVPLLKTLAHNITMYSEQLNIKMCGDILYSLSVLNYFDENLLIKVMLDLVQVIPENKRAPVLGSIVTSIGLLRYKDPEVLDVINKWVVDNYELLRVQDFIAALQCFATFGYYPQNMSDLQKHITSLKEENVKDSELWLDFVWSLTILGIAEASHISSVLEPAFVKKIIKVSEQKYMPKILKLLNINGAAQVLQEGYNGPLLNTTADLFAINIERRKQKQEFIELLNETLSEIAPLRFQTNVYTKMGFFIDAECCIDSDNNFIRLDDISKNPTNTRLALMVHDYHDYSRGKEDLLGVIQFYNRILTAKNYKILNISYHNFSINDKLIKRVKYLNEQIKSIQNL